MHPVMADPFSAEPAVPPAPRPVGGGGRGLLRALAFWLLVVLLLAATVFVVLWDGWR
jgi:hypothetical protein